MNHKDKIKPLLLKVCKLAAPGLLVAQQELLRKKLAWTPKNRHVLHKVARGLQMAATIPRSQRVTAAIRVELLDFSKTCLLTFYADLAHTRKSCLKHLTNIT